AEFLLANLRDVRLEHLFDRPREVIARPRSDLAHELPEAQDEAALVRTDDEDSGGEPEAEREEDDRPRPRSFAAARAEPPAQGLEDVTDLGERIVGPPAPSGAVPEWIRHPVEVYVARSQASTARPRVRRTANGPPRDAAAARA